LTFLTPTEKGKEDKDKRHSSLLGIHPLLLINTHLMGMIHSFAIPL